jgi:hypothetical protein
VFAVDQHGTPVPGVAAEDIADSIGKVERIFCWIAARQASVSHPLPLSRRRDALMTVPYSALTLLYPAGIWTFLRPLSASIVALRESAEAT